MIKKRKWLVFLLWCLSLTIWAQEEVTITGGVQDAFLECGLRDFKLTLMREDSVVVECEPKIFNTGSGLQMSTFYQITVPNKASVYLLKLTKDGYDDGWSKVVIPDGYKGEMMGAPVIKVRKSLQPRVLGEAVVQATRIKVKMRGDTLVYDATAFNLPQGSMLSHLIEQLPGAKMTDAGEIYVNGRKIDELTLNSRTLFKGNKKVLLENLPYFTVKELKVFERLPLTAVLAKQNDAEKEYIMDVNLKNEYALGCNLNGELGGGTRDRYLAKLFGFLLTNTLTVGGYANFNNINDHTKSSYGNWGKDHVGRGGKENHPASRKACGIEVDYQSEKKIGFGFPQRKLNTEIVFISSDDLDEGYSYRERFLSSSTAYSRTYHRMDDRHLSLHCYESFHVAPWGLIGNLTLAYDEDQDRHRMESKQWESLQKIIHQDVFAKGKTREYGLSDSRLNWSIRWVPNLSMTLSGSALRKETKRFNRQISGVVPQTDDYRHEYQDLVSTYFRYEQEVGYGFYPLKGVQMRLNGHYKMFGTEGTDHLFVLNQLDGWGLKDSVQLDLLPSNRDVLWRVFDPVNSNYSKWLKQEAMFELQVKLLKSKKLPFSTTFKLPMTYEDERMDYRRHRLDTLAKNHRFAFHPSIVLHNDRFHFQVGYESSMPALWNMMPYRDERNPLSILEGNSALRNNEKINAHFSWNKKLNQQQEGSIAMRLTSDFVYYFNSFSQGFTYDSETGAYCYRLENVRGNWDWKVSHDLSLALDKHQRWWLDNQLRASVMHSVDHVAVAGVSVSQLNRMETIKPSNSFTLRYTGKSTKAMLLGELSWRRTWGHRPAQPSISALDYRYGMNLQHTISSWNTTFFVDGMMYSRRGYSSAAMNRDEWVVNAAVSRSLLQGAMTVRLEAKDIFNRLSGTIYEVNAQGRTESWHRILPNYWMLHLTYRFNKHPKK